MSTIPTVVDDNHPRNIRENPGYLEDLMSCPSPVQSRIMSRSVQEGIKTRWTAASEGERRKEIGTRAIDGGGGAYNLDDSMISWCSQLFRDIWTVWYHICCTQIAEQAFTGMGDVILRSDVVHPEHSGYPTYTGLCRGSECRDE